MWIEYYLSKLPTHARFFGFRRRDIQLTDSKSLQRGKMPLGVCEQREIWENQQEREYVCQEIDEVMTKISGDISLCSYTPISGYALSKHVGSKCSVQTALPLIWGKFSLFVWASRFLKRPFPFNRGRWKLIRLNLESLGDLLEQKNIGTANGNAVFPIHVENYI